MASPICTCGHSARAHRSPTQCGVMRCACVGYKPETVSVVPSGTVSIGIDVAGSASTTVAVTKTADGKIYVVPPMAGPGDKVVAGGTMPTARHDTAMVDIMYRAAAHSIAAVQTGSWTYADIRKIADIGHTKGCRVCGAYHSNNSATLANHLGPQHVADVFGLKLDDRLRGLALEEMGQIVSSGKTAEQVGMLTGWRQFDVQYNRGGMETPDGTWVPELPEPRFWLSGAQGNYWQSGEYAAVCAKAKRGSYTVDYGKRWTECRDLCIQHYEQSGGTIDPVNLTIGRAECTCGVYAVSDRKRIMGHDGNTGSSRTLSGTTNAKGVVWGYGKAHVGADAASWRATDAMLNFLVIYPTLQINGATAPVQTVHGPWARYSVAKVDWEQVAQDLAQMYGCPVQFASGTRWADTDADGNSIYDDKVEFVKEPVALPDWLSGGKA